MGKKITISLLQMRIVPGNVSKNLEKACSLVKMARDEGAELAVLPEMFSSGFYYTDMIGVSGETPAVISHLRKLCREMRISLVFSVPENDGSAIFNTAYVIGRDGKRKGKYRKVHLFGLFMEDIYFSRGSDTALISLPSLKIAPLICYDLRFPEISRKMTLSGAEVIVYCSQWPKERLFHFRTLLQARAIENQLYVIAANGCGKSGKIELAGHSMIVSPLGDILMDCGRKEGCYTATIDKDEILQFRRIMPCLKDRHPEAY